MIDWLGVLESGIREHRPDWHYEQSTRTFGSADLRCLVVGPWDAKVVYTRGTVLVFFGVHRYQHRLYLDSPNLFDQIVHRAALDGDAPWSPVEVLPSSS